MVKIIFHKGVSPEKEKFVEPLFYRQKQNPSPHPTNNSRNPAYHCQTQPATPPNGSLPTKLYIKLAKHPNSSCCVIVGFCAQRKLQRQRPWRDMYDTV